MTSGNNGNENRRGSSIFAASAAEEGDVSGPYGRPAYLYGRNDGHEQLLVDFPDQTMGGNHYPQQQQQGPGVGYPPQQGNHGPSAATGPNPNSAAVAYNTQMTPQQYQQYQQYQHYRQAQQYQQAQYSHQSHAQNPGQPRRSEAARMEELADSQDLPGGLNHRPLVGGFAAAAYEAAKAHHYSMKKSGVSEEDEYGREEDGKPKNGGKILPSI